MPPTAAAAAARYGPRRSTGSPPARTQRTSPRYAPRTGGTAATGRSTSCSGDAGHRTGPRHRCRGPFVSRLRSGRLVILRVTQVEPVGVHHLGPGPDEVLDELLLPALLGIDLALRAQLGVRAEDQVGARRPPGLAAAGAVAGDVFLAVRSFDRLPDVGHLEQVDEEVVGQLPGARGEVAVAALAVVGAEHAQAADQRDHLGHREAEQARTVEHHLLDLHRELLLTNVVADRVGLRLHHREAVGGGLLLGRVAAPAGERHRLVAAGGRDRLL